MINKDYRNDLKNMIALSGVVAFFFLLVLLHLVSSIRLSNVRYEMSHLEKEKKKLQLEVQSLRFQVATVSRMDRVDSLFREKYGYLPVQLSNHIATIKLPREPAAGETK